MMTEYVWTCGRRWAHIKMWEDDMLRLKEDEIAKTKFERELDRVLGCSSSHIHSWQALESEDKNKVIVQCYADTKGDEIESTKR